MSLKRTAAVLVVGAALLASMGAEDSGCGSDQKSSVEGDKKAKVAKVGQALTITGDDDLKASVKLNTARSYLKGDGSIAQKPKSGRYVVINVTISVATGNYNFNPLYFKYQAADGNTFDAFDGNAVTAGFDPTLDSGELRPGQRTRGNVVFDVPKARGAQKVQLTDPLGGIVGEWALTV